MDTEIHTESRDKESNVDFLKLRFLPFYQALEANDHTLMEIDITKEQFEEICTDFIITSRGKLNNLEERIRDFESQILFLGTACSILSKKISIPTIDALAEKGYKIDIDNLEDGIKGLVKKIKSIQRKLRMTKDLLPPTSKTASEANAYDILSSMASNLEFSIDFEKITIGEYLAHQKTLARKAESIKRLSNG